MRDQRVENLAKILVQYSTAVKKDEAVVIGGASSAEPLLLAIYEEVLRAGGNPIVQMAPEEAAASFYRLASDEQLDWIPPTTQWVYDNADVVIRVISDDNTRALSNVDPAKQARTQSARKDLSDTMMRRAAEGSLRWSLTAFPTHGLAGEAGMALTEYEDFYYKACLATDGDPVTAWARTSDETERLAEWIQGKEEVHITGPGTDVKLNVSEGGRVIDASAQQGEDFLLEMLDTDQGARTLGELGIGTNYGIATGTREILLDEKIGGTIHMAIGKAYPESGGVNDSAVHWDMVCDLRQGGRITVDGEDFQVDGRFIV
jgi:aminopeptidase